MDRERLQFTPYENKRLSSMSTEELVTDYLIVMYFYITMEKKYI